MGKAVRTKPRSVTSADVAIGEKIKARRNLAGMSQEQLGKAVDVSFQQIQKYENGTNRVGAARLAQIAKALGESCNFFTADDKPISLDGQHMQRLLSEPIIQRGAFALDNIGDNNLKYDLVRILEQIAALV